jgi:hypothetical protein
MTYLCALTYPFPTLLLLEANKTFLAGRLVRAFLRISCVAALIRFPDVESSPRKLLCALSVRALGMRSPSNNGVVFAFLAMKSPWLGRSVRVCTL